MNGQRHIFLILAVSAGNLVEGFDFYVSACCAISFASSFFSVGNFTAHLLKQQVFLRQASHG